MKETASHTPSTSSPEFKHWSIVELMGHVRLAGLVTEEQRFGVTLGRVDIPQGDTWVTQYFGGAAVYRITTTTEKIARAIANPLSQRRPAGLLTSGVKLPDDEESDVESPDDEDMDDEDLFGDFDDAA